MFIFVLIVVIFLGVLYFNKPKNSENVNLIKNDLNKDIELRVVQTWFSKDFVNIEYFNGKWQSIKHMNLLCYGSSEYILDNITFESKTFPIKNTDEIKDFKNKFKTLKDINDFEEIEFQKYTNMLKELNNKIIQENQQRIDLLNKANDKI